MATVTFVSPVLTVTFTPTELLTVQRILAVNPGALQALLTNWLQQHIAEFQQKDVVNIHVALSSATPQTITQVAQLLGIPQT